MRTTKLRTTCPHCGRENDRQTGTGESVPKNGDVALCWGCLRLSVYVMGRGNTALRKPTRAEQVKYDGDPDVRAALEAARTSLWPPSAVTQAEKVRT